MARPMAASRSCQETLSAAYRARRRSRRTFTNSSDAVFRSPSMLHARAKDGGENRGKQGDREFVRG